MKSVTSRILSAVLLFSFPVAARAQGADAPLTASAPAQPEVRRVPFNLGVVPGLEVNSVAGERVVNNVSLSVGISSSHQLDGLAASAAGSIVEDKSRGLQASGAFNTAGEVVGIQSAGAFNRVTGGVNGLQSAGGFNLADGTTRGIQAAGGFNLTGSTMLGLQAAGGFNTAGKDSRGVQVAGGFNHVAEGFQGLQAAGGLNLASGPMGGAQFAVVNVAREFEGAQVGVANVAKQVRGLQIGVVNVADDSDVPIGLVNIIRNGRQTASLWASETAVANAGLKLGGRYFHSMLTASAQPSTEPLRWTLGFGFGGHIEGEKWFLDIDAVASNFYYGDRFETSSLLSTLRLEAGWKLYKDIAIIGGPSLNVLTLINGAEESGLPRHWGEFEAGSSVRIWPGFFAGIQI